MHVNTTANPLYNSQSQKGWGICRPALINHFKKYLGKLTTVLDIGCAAGGYTKYLNELGYKAKGIDIDLPEISQADNSFVLANADFLPFANNSFDHCIAINVLEHLNDTECLKEIRRVIRKNVCGIVPALESNSNISFFNLTYHAYTDLTHLRYYNLVLIKDLLLSCGFQVVDLRYTNPANVIGAAIHAMRFPLNVAEFLGNLLNKGPFFRKYFTTIMFIAEKE